MFIHIDINSYFATLLQQENPHFRGKPVGVVKSAGRTCVIAASKEAKKLGVTTGCSTHEARKLAPNIIFVPAEFDFYLHATKKLKSLFESVTPDAKIFSLDEAFIPLQNLRLLYPNPLELAKLLQRRVKEELGEWVTCNVGIAKNRLLAKMASEVAPKGSICEVVENIVDEPRGGARKDFQASEVPPQSGGTERYLESRATGPRGASITRYVRVGKTDLLQTIKFKDVCGIGLRLEAKLAAFGVRHPFEINTLSDETLELHFGPFLSKEIRKVGKGEGSYILDRIDENPHMKSVGRTITGYRLCDNEDTIRVTLYNLMEEVTHKVRQMDMAGRYVGIFLTGEDKSWHAHKTLKRYVRHTNEMFQILYGDLYKNFMRSFKVIRYGVMLGSLKPLSEVPPTLFPEWYKNERLYKAIDTISEKFGLFTVRTGILANRKVIRPEVTGYLGDKKYQFLSP